MKIICEQCEKPIEVPKHQPIITCSCGARYKVDAERMTYDRIPRLNITRIAVDFDGTIVEDHYPLCGPVFPEASDVLRRFHDAGGKIIIWTCRTGQDAADAIDHLRSEQIPYDAFNRQLPGACEAFVAKFPHLTIPDGRKVAADLYIDDKNPGGVDWEQVNRLLFGEADNDS